MSIIEFNEDYKTALAQSRIYLDPFVGINRQDLTNHADKQITRQLNILISLVVSLHTKVEKLTNQVQILEDSLRTKPDEV